MSELALGGSAQLPAHIAAAFGATTNEDLTAGVSGGYPIISYRGKTWALVQGGERNVIYKDDGDPLQSLEVVIVKSNPNISKIYYPDGYEEGSTEKPSCYSNDGVAPGLDAQDPQATKCAVCPHNQWGSRVTENGAKGKACSDLRRLAVAAAGDLENPMLLRVPAASLRGLVDYAAALQKRQTPYQAVVTKIGFDPEAAYPKLTFKPVRWLEAHEVPVVQGLMQSDVVGQITTLNMAAVEREQEREPSQAEKDLDALGPPPGQVQQSANVEQLAPRRGRKAAVTRADVEQVVGQAEPEPAKVMQGDMFTSAPAQPVAEPKAAPAAAQASTVLTSADSALDEALASLDFDD